MSDSYAFRYVARSLCRSALVIGMALGATSVVAQDDSSTTSQPTLTGAQLTQLDGVLTQELQQIVNQKRWFERQTHAIRITARYDIQTQAVIVDLGEEYGPQSLYAEDLQGWLRESAAQIVSDIAPFKGVSLLYGGKDMYYWFPEERRAPRPEPARKPQNHSILEFTLDAPSH